jgi:hypothetical protein
MKKTIFLAIVLSGVRLLFPAAAANDLPPAVLLELKHLEETYRVLDIAAPKIWPGWTDYREVPFHLGFENGLRVMIGHPNPPSEFQLLPNVQCAGRPVAVDRSKVSALVLKAPLSAGGGPIPIGQTTTGQPVTVVDLKFTRRDTRERVPDEPDIAPTENQILICIHELFHCYQRAHVKGPYLGNFRFNPDLNYAVYSEIEGRALERAYGEPAAEKAIAALMEFLAARDMKRRGSMSNEQSGEESSDELREGGATYAEVRTLEVLSAGGLKPGLTESEDPEYHGFARAAELLKRYPARLHRDAAQSADNYSKAYSYGCFQALLCQRLFPGWQESLTSTTHFFDTELSRRLPMSAAERSAAERRLAENYPLAEIRERQAKFIDARDGAYRLAKARSGRTYILDFKRTGQFISSLVDEKSSYSIGLTRVHPGGLGPMSFDDVKLSRVEVPAEIDQLYYLKIVDTEWQSRSDPVKVTGERQPDGSWKDAEVRTSLFVLAAPHVQIRISGNRVKIQVLSRVK